ncbi:MAG TPA: hypothetical protein VMS60_15930 [Solirubrobacterales bacterium]|nr:hypothetical protein [Solirubrobacterales bacterium]
MATSKFNPDTCQTFAEGIFDGLTIAEAAKAAGIAAKTAKNWLSRGRKELRDGGGPYADFVLSIEEVRRQVEDRKEPMSKDELKLVVSETAKAGSVQAQKLYFEMLKAEKGNGNTGDPDDPFADLDGDEVAAARAKRAA